MKMVKMKTDKCPTCGGIVLKLAGRASKLCFDECPDCRRKRDDRLKADIDAIDANIAHAAAKASTTFVD
jgi:hypothetical protein